jgi:hypothetical protein
MARGKAQQQSAAVDADQQAALPKGAVVDGRTERVFAPMDTVSSELEPLSSTDTVEEVLAGNYSEGIVDEVGVSLLACRVSLEQGCRGNTGCQ